MINLTKKPYINLTKKTGNTNIFTSQEWANVKKILKLNK